MKQIQKMAIVSLVLSFLSLSFCFASLKVQPKPQPETKSATPNLPSLQTPPTSISYVYNSKTNAYYYYALQGKTLYYLNHDKASNQWVWEKWDTKPFPANYGFLAVAIDASGNRYVEALGSDGVLYDLHISPLTTPFWLKVPNVNPLVGPSPTCLVYYYSNKQGWIVRTMAGGHYYALRSNDDGKTYSWVDESSTVPPLPGHWVTMASAMDKNGNSNIYALADGQLYLLEEKPDAQTFFWKALTNVDPLTGGLATITIYYDGNGGFAMYAAIDGMEYQLNEDNNHKWHWDKTSIPFL
jgi:hypothetical protein